ncbi:DUF4132 domain-containing protein [Streptosporangium sp. 'caverna']|uniref:DUF4132 domain-containing protein n=1 Tax=Streptosporangium sp. 'caverna' TaxID=2202249 RepID=UPI000D7DC526|nr:DUF4132 domain-containing protein [Streptosporangium sp. 'caverna']AWS46163.1 hypothetical protein DKM19_37580 [Streptosporangium sp. 'caverna']
MTDIHEINLLYTNLHGYVSDETRETCRRFEALLEQGLEPGPDTDWRAYGYWAQLKLGLGEKDGHDHYERVLRLIRSVAERDIDWTPGDAHIFVRQAHELVYRGHNTRYEEIFLLPFAVTRRCGFRERREILGWMGEPGWHSQSRVAEWKPAREALAGQLEELLVEPAEHGPAGVVRNVIWEGDAFAWLLAEEYGPRLADPAVLPLLRHWRTARSTKPSGKWLKTAKALLTPETVGLLREILTRLVSYRERKVNRVSGDLEWEETVFLDERTAVPVRGMVWTCEAIEERWVTSLLGDVALNCGTGSRRSGMGSTCRSEMITNAAVGVLARRGGPAAIVPLARLQAKARVRSVLNNVARTLDALADEAGLTREQLVDRTVPAFGLGQDGVREEKIGDYLVRLCADGLTLRFVNAAGKTVKSAPQAIRKDPALADLKITLKELKQALSAERFRLEQALIKERAWRWQEVAEFFLDHPVTGLYARTLIWQVPQGPAGLPVRTEVGWEFTDPRGHRTQLDPDTSVQLWHPIHATAEEVRAWRDHLLEHGIRQPYKQAFREIYLLTPAEEQTGTYSNRFAGHVLRYGQAKALLNQRGWTGLAIGHWDYEGGGDRGEAIRELSGWRARWGMHVTGEGEADEWGTASFCAGEQITFYRDEQELSERDQMGNRVVREGVPLAEVPPLVLSEVLRDADLAVGVASVGLDQQATGGHEAYWNSYGFGELTETARTRHDALTRLLPRLKIADRAELTDRFLRVRGDRRTYKIHLGSGNILMEPNDAYLCIVPGHDRGTASVFLPFEEDGGMLSIILSKAFLLADDTTITDPSITRQLDA